MTEKDEFTQYFKEIQLKISRLYALMVTDSDLTIPQYAVLNQLLSSKSMAMTEVGEKLHITKPAVTNLVDRLENKGYLKRVPHPNDRRVNLLELQPKGEKIARKIQTHFLSYLLDTFSGFNSTDRQTILKFYAALSKTIDGALVQPEKDSHEK